MITAPAITNGIIYEIPVKKCLFKSIKKFFMFPPKINFKITDKIACIHFLEYDKL